MPRTSLRHGSPADTSERRRGLIRPLQDFLNTETTGGLLLLAATLAALVWANSPVEGSYRAFWDARVALDFNRLTLDLTLVEWVNDAFMAVFFFVVGLEIKRELLRGELASPRKAALPVAAALGGMIVPAVIYLAFNFRGEGERGWAIPMATDIAFAVGIMALLGPRVPLSLKVFLLALAIADDIGAIVVIAIAYTDDISPVWLGAAAGLIVAMFVLGRAGVREMWAYVALAMAVWLAVYESGVHATIAGVALGLIVPEQPYRGEPELESAVAPLMDDYERGLQDGTRRGDEQSRSAARDLESVARESRPLLYRLEHTLHPWTSYAVLPLFALANAGVKFGGGSVSDAVASPVSWGIAGGLIIGKPLGITLASLIAVRLGIGVLPDGVSWRQLAAMSMVAGIGFTVSLFITAIAFSNQDLVNEAKVGVLAGSVVIGSVGAFALWRTCAGSEGDLPVTTGADGA